MHVHVCVDRPRTEFLHLGALARYLSCAAVAWVAGLAGALPKQQLAPIMIWSNAHEFVKIFRRAEEAEGVQSGDWIYRRGLGAGSGYLAGFSCI